MTARRTPALAFAIGLAAVGAAHAQVNTSNVASIEPTSVAHPPTTPCSVPLYTGAVFGSTTVAFHYAPPAACPGPWAKVVLAIDNSVGAGRQYDRTGTIWLGGVNLWFGTTAEPRSALSPSWHVERDVTDDTALFEAAGSGAALIANYYDSVHVSSITSSATLLFYPADATHPAPRTPDVIIPLTGTASAPTSLATGTDALTLTTTLPPNIERAELDTVLQSQSADEEWYADVPASLATGLEEDVGGNFREGELTIDGKNAGLAPVYPAVFTGGIDPLLWTPTPGVTTLDLRPFRIELTPFAGQLDRPGPHTISLSVFGATNYFSVEGTLYLFLDHGASADTGALTGDTLGAPSPVVTDALTGTTEITGSLLTTSEHDYQVSGVLSTSHGQVATSVRGTSSFRNSQRVDATASTGTQDILQDTETTIAVTTATNGGTGTTTTHYSYPFATSIKLGGTDTDTLDQTTQIAQGLLIASRSGSAPPSLLAEGILSQDSTYFATDPTTGALTIGPPTNAASAAVYGSNGHFGCYGRLFASTADVLRVAETGEICAGDAAARAVQAIVAGVGR